MRANNLLISFLILVVAVGASGQTLKPSGSRVALEENENHKTEPVTTNRLLEGVWFIEGGTLYDVFEAQGYAVAQDRLWQMDLFRRQGRGTLSELLGPSQVQNDILLRTIGYSDAELAEAFNNLPADAKTAIQGYVDGVNRRVLEILSNNFMQMPYEYWVLSLQSVLLGPGQSVLPAFWTVNDILGFAVAFQRDFDGEAQGTGQLDNGVMAQRLGGAYGAEGLAMFADQRWYNDPSALTMIPINTPVKNVSAPVLTMDEVEALPDLEEAATRIRSRFDTFNQDMEDLSVRVKLGSYAWAVSGDKTNLGYPIVYSGPQMGFMTPSILTEGSIRGGGLEVSGMHLPGVPGIAIGRTPHHAWSAQTGMAHTLDYFIEGPPNVSLHRVEVIKVFGGDDVLLPVYRSSHGPIIEPIPYFPDNPPVPPNPIVSWAYANWGHELDAVDFLLDLARAESIEEFDAGVEKVGVSMHFTYADREGNIAYWMAGWDPIRAQGSNPLIPQPGDGSAEWTGERRPRVHDANNSQGYYGGWNNKASLGYGNAPNAAYFGPAHRAHVVDDYLSTHDDLTFEEVRDLALNIATTDSYLGGGNTWSFVEDFFKAAVAANPSDDRDAAIAMLDAWDGHFVEGGPSEWPMGTQRADAWVLQDEWTKEAIRLIFEDEFAGAGMDWQDQSLFMLYNVMLRALQGQNAALPVLYNWFQDKSGSGKPTTAEGIIIQALDTVIAEMGLGSYGVPRGEIVYTHLVFGEMWRTPFSSRSTYAHCVEFDMNGPSRIESMFPLGETGEILPNQYGQIQINPLFFGLTPAFDLFMPRSFPVFY